MDKPIRNPFRFGDPVEGEYYFPRPELTKATHQFLENKIHVVLLGPRRMGKTSFLIDTIRREEAAGKTCLLIDVFNVTSHHDFLQQMIRAVSLRKNWARKLIESVPRLKPKVSLEFNPITGESKYSLRFELISEKDVKELIQDTLEGLGKLGASVIVAFDEFQKVSEIHDEGWLEGTLRTEMQRLKNTVFLFSGSRRSMVHDMFNNPSRPFYRTCQLIDIPSLEEDFSNWIVARFRSVGINCDKNAIIELRRLVQDTPNYVQMACFHLVAQAASSVTIVSIRSVLRTIVKQNAYAYQTLLSSLTAIQQRALRLAANHSEEIFSKERFRKYQIPNGPTLASAIKALKKKQLLDHEGTTRGKVIFDDPLFSIWLKSEF